MGTVALAPCRLVPAVPEHRSAVEHPGAALHRVEQLGLGADAGQVEPGEGESGVGGVDVTVDEGREDEGTGELDDAVGSRRACPRGPT